MFVFNIYFRFETTVKWENFLPIDKMKKITNIFLKKKGEIELLLLFHIIYVALHDSSVSFGIKLIPYI